jgi:hypothetical protein
VWWKNTLLKWYHVFLEIVINEIKKLTKVRSWGLDMHLVNMIWTICDLKIFGFIWNVFVNNFVSLTWIFNIFVIFWIFKTIFIMGFYLKGHKHMVLCLLYKYIILPYFPWFIIGFWKVKILYEKWIMKSLLQIFLLLRVF